MRHIVKLNDISWSVDDNGKIIGKREDGFPQYEFWIGNPPAQDSNYHDLFVTVCDFGVKQNILRRIHMFTLKGDDK